MKFLTTLSNASASATANASDLATLSKEDKGMLMAMTGAKTASVANLKKAGAADALAAVDATFRAFQLEALGKQAQLEIVLYAREQGWNAESFGKAFAAAMIAAGATEKTAKNRAAEARTVMSHKGELPTGTESLQNLAKACRAMAKGADAETAVTEAKGRAPRQIQTEKHSGKADAAGVVTSGKDPAAEHMANITRSLSWFKQYLKPSDAEALELVAAMVDLAEDLDLIIRPSEEDAA